MSKKIFTALIFPFLITAFLYAGDRKESVKPVKIVFFDIRENTTRGTISNKLRTGLSMVLNTVLLGNRYVKSVLQKKGKKSRCFSSSCAVELGTILKADKVITGEIKISDKSTYHLLLSVTDVTTGNVDLTIKVKSSTPDMNAAVKNALEKMKVFFNKVKKPGEKPLSPARKSVSPYKISINILGSRIFTYGPFRSMATSGYGFKVKPEIREALFSKSVFQFSTSYYSYRGENRNFNSFNSVELGVLAGYSISIAKQFRVIPLLGAGYNINIINEKEGGKTIHSDPRLTAGLDIIYLLSGDLRLLFSPSYTLFFEKDNTGRYLGINAGLGYNF
jgi:hypothetical protein